MAKVTVQVSTDAANHYQRWRPYEKAHLKKLYKEFRKKNPHTTLADFAEHACVYLKRSPNAIIFQLYQLSLTNVKQSTGYVLKGKFSQKEPSNFKKPFLQTIDEASTLSAEVKLELIKILLSN